MSITTFNPKDIYTAGNLVVNLMPAVADINAPTLEEWNAGTMVQCAIEELEMSTDAKSQERKKLCDRVATQATGSRTYSAGNLTLVSEDPQGENPLPAVLENDAVVFVGVRPGLDHKVPVAAGQKVWVDHREVVAIDPKTITTDDGDAFQWDVQFTVKDRTYKGTIGGAPVGP